MLPVSYFIPGITDHENRIHKTKYAEDRAGKGSSSDNDRQARGTTQDLTPEKRRDKSRTRTIFGRKKSVSQQR